MARYGSKGVTRCPNQVLLPWLQAELAAIVETLPAPPDLPATERRALWAQWQEGLQVRISLPTAPPPLRMLLILDNLVGHKHPAFVRGCFAAASCRSTRPWAVLGSTWLSPSNAS